MLAAHRVAGHERISSAARTASIARPAAFSLERDRSMMTDIARAMNAPPQAARGEGVPRAGRRMGQLRDVAASAGGTSAFAERQPKYPTTRLARR